MVKQRLRIGSHVRLIRTPKAGTAKIVKRLSDIRGGVVLDSKLDGFRCWNIQDLERVPQDRKVA